MIETLLPLALGLGSVFVVGVVLDLIRYFGEF